MRLEGKTAIITGAGTGIGEATAELFAKEGASVVLVGRREEMVKGVANRIIADGGSALAVAVDVASSSDCKNVFDLAIREFGKVDIVVNSAGTGETDTIDTATDEIWDRVIATNLTGTFNYCREAVLHMRERMEGSIINVASTNALRPISTFSYSTSKWGVLGLTKHVAFQYAGTKLRCNAVCPGYTHTPLTGVFELIMANGGVIPEELEKALPKESVALIKRHMSATDLSLPWCDPIDQAKTILFLASDDSIGLNGAVIAVDKGEYL